MELPPFTLEGLQACIAGNPADFYLTSNPDLREHADLRLVVEGQELPAHAAVLAQRAAVFAPLLASPGSRLEEPFGINRLQHALLLLRLCYRPEEAKEGLAQCFDALLDLLPTLHRVDATRFLSAVDLSDKPPAVLLAWLNACTELQTLEPLAAECVSRIVNGVKGHASSTEGPPTDMAFTCLGMADLAVEGLSAPAAALLCRAALAVVADARSRNLRLRVLLNAEARREEDPAVRQRMEAQARMAQTVRDLSAGDVLVLTQRSTRGSYAWELPPIGEDELGADPILSPSFSIGGLDWRLRLVPEADWPQGVPKPGWWMEELGEELKACSVWLEALQPERLPPAGLQAYVTVSMANWDPDYPGWGVNERQLVTLTPTAPTAAFHPYCDNQDVLTCAYDYKQSRFVFKLHVNVCLLPDVPGAPR